MKYSRYVQHFPCMSDHQSSLGDSKTAWSKSILQLTDHILCSLSFHPLMGLSVFMFPCGISLHFSLYDRSQETNTTAKLHPLTLVWPRLLLYPTEVHHNYTYLSISPFDVKSVNMFSPHGSLFNFLLLLRKHSTNTSFWMLRSQLQCIYLKKKTALNNKFVHLKRARSDAREQYTNKCSFKKRKLMHGLRQLILYQHIQQNTQQTARVVSHHFTK